MTTVDLRLEYKNSTGTYPGNDEEKAYQNDFIDMMDYVKWLEEQLLTLKNEKL